MSSPRLFFQAQGRCSSSGFDILKGYLLVKTFKDTLLYIRIIIGFKFISWQEQKLD